MRDIRKDAIYFERYIENKRNNIAEFRELINSISDENKASAFYKLLIDNRNLVVAMFSKGCSVEEIAKEFDGCILYALSSEDLPYEMILNILSLSVLLDCPCVELIDNNADMINEDKLLSSLASFIKDGSKSWEGSFVIEGLYDEINDSVSENSLLDCLYSWYAKREDFWWYDTDKLETDSYIGYWAFELAALAKIFEISEEKLSQNIYYPVL